MYRTLTEFEICRQKKRKELNDIVRSQNEKNLPISNEISSAILVKYRGRIKIKGCFSIYVVVWLPTPKLRIGGTYLERIFLPAFELRGHTLCAG